MLVHIIYFITSTCALLGVGGDWYLSKVDMIYINSCYIFPSGTFNLWDSFCGLSAEEFLSYRSNFIQENVFIFTVEQCRLFTALAYGFAAAAMLAQFFIPNFYKTHVALLNLCCTSSITAVIFFLYGTNLLENKELKDNIYNVQFGFISECFVIALSFILGFYKIKLSNDAT